MLNYTEAGTQTGLPKMTYLRDTRRSIGLDGFRLTYPPMNNEGNGSVNGSYTGVRFYDSVAIGDYPVDIHQLNPKVCVLPSYAKAGIPILPYYIPFRALTSIDTPNLLVSGKTMAQTFLANAATRLHPSEWTSGVAAGVAAALMVQNSWPNTQTVLDNIGVLQDRLTQPDIQQPLLWNFE